MASNNKHFALLRLHLLLIPSMLAFLSAYVSLAGPGPQTSKAAVQTEEDIREAIVRYQMAEVVGENDVSCLQIRKEDPSREFLLRFKDDLKVLQKESECGKGMKTNGRRVYLFQGSIRWINHDAVKVDGGYQCGLLCASKGTFIVKRKKERWSVTRFKASWYS